MESEIEKQNPEVVKDRDDKPLLEGISLDFSMSSPSISSSSSSSSSSSGEIDANEMSPLNNSPDSTSSSMTALAEAQTKSPPIQTMGRPGEYDPNRIPTSIFSSKPSNPTECWSNESLFSIHMGNNSFSQDHAILFGKSGEFPRVDDWYNSLPKSSEIKPVSHESSSSLPMLVEIQANEEKIVKAGQSVKVNVPMPEIVHVPENKVVTPNNIGSPWKMPEIVHVPEKNMTDAKPASPNLSSPSTPRMSFLNPRLSNESGSSFAFPVLVSDSGKSQGSLKVMVEKPHEKKTELRSQVSKPKTPKAIPTTMISWFSCSWWRRCC